MKTVKLNRHLALTAILLNTCAVAPAYAASSDWVNLYGGEARLSAVKDPDTNKITGIVEIKLKEGWKTYWRNPGDAGIPPIIDFTGSTFFTLDKISFPIPEILTEDGTQFIGYHNTVQFVFSGQAEGSAASLKVNFTAGVCEKICIPATAEFEFLPNALNQSDPKTSRTLMLSKSYLPREPSTQFSLSNVKRKGGKYSVTANIPKALSDPKLLIEGPKGWFSGVLVPNEFSNQISFNLPTDLPTDLATGLPTNSLTNFLTDSPSNVSHQGVLKNQMRYTLIANGQAVEGTLTIDDKVE